MPNKILRTLIYDDAQKERKVIGQDQIAAITEPVVILGDPGLGKSVLTQMLGEQPGMKYYRAGTFVRSANPGSMITGSERIIIDGLDEIASTALGGGVELVLKQLSAMGSPPFILSCREADWRGATDRIKIEDDYSTTPVLLHLLPFDRNDAHAFLSDEFPAVDARHVLDHLGSRGLEDIYRNPLTLRLLGEVAQGSGALPNSRAELLDRACRVMLREENPRHFSDTHVQRRDVDLLLAAGAMCAAQLLCDRIGMFTGAYAKTPEGFVHVADSTKLPFGEPASDALKTRLFQADGEGRFTHVHRVIAEYLGAKWLAYCFDTGLSERRIFGLFRQGESVPTSLRGLHAWTGHFSDALSDRCIAADPYAVLRYGDADTLSLEKARALLAALAKLSEEDPYFRSEDWGQHSALGLMRAELKGEILDIVSTPNRHTQLTTLLLGAMVGTSLAKELAPTLNDMIFDHLRNPGERSGAVTALHATGIVTEWEAVIHRLLAMGDAASARLAFEILGDVGLHAVSVQTTVETILAHIGLTVSQVPESKANRVSLARLREGFFDAAATARLETLLDNIAAYARPLIGEADQSAKAQVADLVRHLTVQVLEANPAIAPERLWAWIGWVDGDDGYSDPTKKRLTDVLRKNRTGLLEYVLLTPCETNTWMAGFRLSDTDLDLFPTSEDIAGLLKALRSRAGGGAISVDTWRDVLQLGRSREGIAKIVHSAAIETANGDPNLLATLAEMAQVVVPQWEIEQQEHAASAKARRQAVYQSHRDAYTERAHEVAAGNFYDLAVAADVYLGRRGEFDRSASPVARLQEFLGDTLADQALAGFVAVLSRSDLPSAAEVAELHCSRKHWVAEGPMFCGIAELVRGGQPIDKICRGTLAAVLMAWQRAPESHSEHEIAIGPPLEAVLFITEKDIEAHFRASIEPQLGLKLTHPDELYRLTHDVRWTALSGRLSTEWLRAYPSLSAYAQDELMTCALENATPESLHALIVESRMAIHSDYKTMLMWLSADYIADFDNSRMMLEDAAADDRDFVWFIRDRIEPERRNLSRRLSVTQLAFIVRAFGSQWPKMERPEGVTSGDTNPWDASAFIEHTIYEIANNPSPEATRALQNLIAGPAATYSGTTRHALALQRKARRDNEYVAPTINQLQAVMADALPETIDDMRAYVADRIEAIQVRMKGSNTDMWEAYWAGDKPKAENFCRNRLVEHISGLLPSSIRFEPEMHMPGQKRADIAAIRNSIGLPVEIKGQWHKDVWDAPVDQLDAKYTRDWHAQGRGVYIVIWFGYVPGKQLPAHPDGFHQPTTPEMLRQMLIDRIPEARRSQIDVYVIDVSKPAKIT